MRVLIDDAFATAIFTTPIISGWQTRPEDITIEIVPSLTAGHMDPEDAALAPSSEILVLRNSHVVLTDIAVVSNEMGAIAMRTPVRPDEIEQSPVRLLDTSGTGEFLARATVTPFYGIPVTDWVREGGSKGSDAPQVVIVEGADALREPEAGFSEDLVRAWFIFTASPVVTHLLLAPRGASPDEIERLARFFAALRDVGMRRRGEWIPELASREEIPRERVSAFWAAQRFTLTDADQSAARHLLREGTRGTTGPNPASVEFTAGTAG